MQIWATRHLSQFYNLHTSLSSLTATPVYLARMKRAGFAVEAGMFSWCNYQFFTLSLFFGGNTQVADRHLYKVRVSVPFPKCLDFNIL